MRKTWRVILTIYGLVMFTFLTTYAFQLDRQRHPAGDGRYFWWGSLRLDSDPWNKHPQAVPTKSCENVNVEDCFAWDPEYIWVEPGMLERVLIVSALPAFALGALVCAGFAKLGISQVLTFLITMPILISTWFCFVGWLLDRRSYNRLLKTEYRQPSY